MSKTIGVFFGSRSPEHDVSIITGELIISELKKMGRAVVPIYIGADGAWYISETLGSLKFFMASDWTQKLTESGFNKYYLDLETSKGKMVFKTKGWRGAEVIIDLAFPAFHGAYGEDGTIQGLWEMFNIPYVGCGVAASALAMDKVLTKDLLRAHNNPTAKYLAVTAREWKTDKTIIIQKIRTTLNKTVFVKPARLGSSIGIGKVSDSAADDLEFKIEVAFHYDDLILIEEAVENLVDLTCCVLEDKPLRASEIQESIFSNDLFDFKTKYLDDGGAQLGVSKRGLVIPANIPGEIKSVIQETSKLIFTILGASGIARVDWLYNSKTQAYFVTEVNTLPGTLYHHLWKASGVELRQVIEILLAKAAERHADKARLTHTFPSKLLAQAGSIKLMGSKLS